MSFCEIDWKVHLTGETLLQPDIKFRVVEKDQENDTEKVTIIPAHKFVLAGVSDVFATQFYGSLPEIKTTIDLEDTSTNAAKMFFDYIYEKLDEFSLPPVSSSIEDLYLLLKMADKYWMIPLVKRVNGIIKNFHLTKENLMKVAAVAEKYKVLFSKVSADLWQRCADFLGANIFNFTNLQEIKRSNDQEFDAELFRKLVCEATAIHFIDDMALDGKQHWFRCLTCGMVRDYEGCCIICARVCHRGHHVTYKGVYGDTYCECGFGECERCDN